jgi:hypothetical protein
VIVVDECPSRSVRTLGGDALPEHPRRCRLPKVVQSGVLLVLGGCVFDRGRYAATRSAFWCWARHNRRKLARHYKQARHAQRGISTSILRACP